jgi:hypothetical protein
MASNQELTHENKELKKQVSELEARLSADTVSKDDYDKVKSELDALNLQMNAISVPTMKAEVDATNRKLETAINERNQARQAVIELGNKVRELEANQRVDSDPTEAPKVQKNYPVAELRILTAICLMSSKEESGRPMNTSTVESTKAGMVSAARKLAEEVFDQTS